MLVSIDGNDVTKHILTSSYNVNALPVYSQWEDANFITHREIHRYKIQGKFELKFPYDEGKAYSEFIQLLKENTNAGVVLLTVFINNENVFRTIEAYYDMAPTMQKSINGKSYNSFWFKVEEV